MTDLNRLATIRDIIEEASWERQLTAIEAMVLEALRNMNLKEAKHEHTREIACSTE